MAAALLPQAGGLRAEGTGTAEAGFQAYLQLLAARARAEGVREATIQAMTAGLAYNPRVIALDRGQPGASSSPTSPDFTPYARQHVDAARIVAGRAKYRELAGMIPGIEARYGVPAPILLSIWGNETSFGKVRGDFDLARSLATLAYDGRRRELFAAEFIALLKMADMGVPRSRLVGSWAGAFGNPQFLPSAYLRLAQDGDGDGVRDIWTDPADTLASIGNFFRDAGWRRGQPWGVRALVPAGLDRTGVASGLAAPSCPRVYARQSRWLTVREWRARGVQPQGLIGDEVLAALIEPDGPGKSAFLLTGNYRVILHYNCSNYYALSVGLLADEIARSP
ncbi:MAG: lytic murein transglycosylase [Proteobacteria bacterium]|nr:lytic murein transglycosylase [Pseudomonadota bacterium]